MKKLAIIGSGDLGQQIAYHALADKHYQPIGFFDDFQTKGSIKHGLPVMGSIEDILDSFKNNSFDVLMVGIGYKFFQKRLEVFQRFEPEIPFGTLVHSSSYIDPSCKLGKGVFIYPGCVLDMNVIIEDNVLLNAGCVIAHDSKVGRNSFLSPAVKVAGFVEIGQSVSLGIGTTVIDNIVINNKVRTGAGAVVVDSLEQAGLYVGVPAKFKKV